MFIPLKYISKYYCLLMHFSSSNPHSGASKGAFVTPPGHTIFTLLSLGGIHSSFLEPKENRQTWTGFPC